MRTLTDPIFAAIEKHTKLMKEWCRLCDAVEMAENKAEKKHGHRPYGLIAWRKYSAIGGSEIDAARKEFLRHPGTDPKKLEKEYRDAKKRERAAIRAGAVWDKLTGIKPLREQCARTGRAEVAAAMRMAKTKPITPAGAGALVAYTRADISENDIEGWPLIAFATAANALASM